MKAFSIAVIVALTSALIIPASAVETELDDSVYGRSAFSVQSSLRDRGFATTSVEEWGGLIRAWVRNDNGSMSMEFFDADTLQPTSSPRG